MFELPLAMEVDWWKKMNALTASIGELIESTIFLGEFMYIMYLRGFYL